MKRARSNPKEVMEADLFVAGGGMFFILMGGLLSVTGFHLRTQNIQDDAPNPVLGEVIVAIGLVIVALGLLMAAVNAVVWLTGRLRRRTG